MFTMNPTHKLPVGPPAKTGGCPFGSNCSCVFSSNQQAQQQAQQHAAASATTSGVIRTGTPGGATDLSAWTDWGWKVVSRDSNEIVLERTKTLPFCFNLSLVVLTGLLWLFYWVPRIRHPKVTRTVLVIGADGRAVEASATTTN